MSGGGRERRILGGGGRGLAAEWPRTDEGLRFRLNSSKWKNKRQKSKQKKFVDASELLVWITIYKADALLKVGRTDKNRLKMTFDLCATPVAAWCFETFLASPLWSVWVCVQTGGAVRGIAAGWPNQSLFLLVNSHLGEHLSIFNCGSIEIADKLHLRVVLKLHHGTQEVTSGGY